MNTTLLSGEKATQQDVDEAKARLPRSSSSLKLEAYHIYSPEEHIVGEWQEMVNGILKKKPVYERIVTSTSGNPNKDYNIFNSSGLDIKELSGFILNNANAKMPITWNWGNEAENGFYISNNGSITLKITRDYEKNCTVQIILKYIKTTDEWEIV